MEHVEGNPIEREKRNQKKPSNLRKKTCLSDAFWGEVKASGLVAKIVQASYWNHRITQVET
jgi:hypothetical protein